MLQKSPEYGNCVVHGVEVINNFLSFDYANNRTLLYIVLRESAIFDRIQELTGPGGILQPRKAEIPLEVCGGLQVVVVVWRVCCVFCLHGGCSISVK